MIDPVMEDLPLRRVLQFVKREWQSVSEIAKAHNTTHPMSLEMWIKLSNAVRRRVFNEKREAEVGEVLSKLEDMEYVECQTGKNHPESPHIELRKETTFYRLTSKGVTARGSIRRGFP
jgi:hypothetical protein